MTRADHPTGTDRVAEVAARIEQARIIVNLQGDEPEIAGEHDRPARRPARRRSRGPDGHPGHADPRRGRLSRPLVRQGRLLAPGPRPLLLAQPDPLPPRRPARARRPRPRPRGPSPPRPLRLPPRLPALDRQLCPALRWRPPRSSSSSASSRPAIPSPSASSTSRASASTRRRITGGSWSGGTARICAAS